MSINISREDKVTVISEEYEGIGFIAIPDYIACNPDLTWSEKSIFGLIHSFIINLKPCIASNGYFAKRLGLSMKTIKVSLQTLEEKGYIVRIIENFERKEIKLSTNAKKLGGGSAKTTLGVVQNLHRGVGRKLHTYNKDYNKDINSQKIDLKKEEERKQGNEYVSESTKSFNESLLAKYHKGNKLTDGQIKYLKDKHLI